VNDRGVTVNNKKESGKNKSFVILVFSPKFAGQFGGKCDILNDAN
jgi:hypothetical protein